MLVQLSINKNVNVMLNILAELLRGWKLRFTAPTSEDPRL